MSALSHDQFNNVPLPGLDLSSSTQRAPLRQFAEHDRSKWSGPIPGQTVMGVHRLGGDAPDRFTDHEAVDSTGFVDEQRKNVRGRWQTPVDAETRARRPAVDLYASHGGYHGKSVREHHALKAEAEGYDGHVTQYLLDTDWNSTDDIDRADERSAKVRETWQQAPVHQIPADAIVHTGQSHEETLDGLGMTAIRASLQNGQPIRKEAWLGKVGGRLYGLDGHHRITAARHEGLSHYPARVIDFDGGSQKFKPLHGVPNYDPISRKWL